MEVQSCRECPHYNWYPYMKFHHIVCSCTHPEVNNDDDFWDAFNEWVVQMIGEIGEIYPGCPLPRITENPDD